MELPPSPGALHVSDTCADPGVPVTPLGALGVVNGVAGELVPWAPLPEALTGVTTNSYRLPFVRPVTVQLVSDDEHVWPPLAELVKSTARTE